MTLATSRPLDLPRPAIPEVLEATRVVAILRHTDAHLAVETADALARGGVRALEVTLNSAGVLDMLRAIQRSLGNRVLLGAGTVLDLASAEAALDAGARFVVSPHTDPSLVAALARRGVPCVPGALTASEVLAAWRAGASVVKLFPAGPVGPGYVKDLLGPLEHVPLLPTGGLTLANAASYVEAGAWGLGVGSALADPALVAARAFDEIERRAAAFVQVAAAARGR